MRRVWGFILLGIGVFLIVLAPMLRFYAADKLAVVPKDQDTTTVATGNGDYLDFGQLKVVEGADMISVRNIRGDVKASSGDRRVWDVFTRIDVVTADGQQETWKADSERMAFHARTQETINCCNETPVHAGIQYKFPFDTQRDKQYDYFDFTTQKTFPMIYQATETLEGVKVYRFNQKVPPTAFGSTEVPASLVGKPGNGGATVQQVATNDRTIWVEPQTGIPVKGSESPYIYLADSADGPPLQTVLKTTLTFDDKTVKAQAKTAKDGIAQIKLISTTIPLASLIIGIIAVVGGLLLLRRRPAAVGPQGADGPVEPGPGPDAGLLAGTAAGAGTAAYAAPATRSVAAEPPPPPASPYASSSAEPVPPAAAVAAGPYAAPAAGEYPAPATEAYAAPAAEAYGEPATRAPEPADESSSASDHRAASTSTDDQSISSPEPSGRGWAVGDPVEPPYDAPDGPDRR